MKKTALLYFTFFGFFLSQAHASLELLPSSRHHQFTPYSLFTESQNALLWRNGGRAWGVVGGALAILEAPDWRLQPQFIMHGTATAAMRLNERKDTLLTETVDARVGFSLEFTYNENFRFLADWTHQSGHATDDIVAREMIGTNLGNEIITFRALYDWKDRVRFGGSLRPNIGSEPKMKVLGLDQFVEVLPWGENANPKHPTPYLALGLEEYGVTALKTTVHAQVGLYFGSHFRKEHHVTLRVVAGFYRGFDPRLKYMQFQQSMARFAYAGLMIEL